MTDATTALTCPECDGPITAEQLAAEGLCPKCIRKTTRDIPPPTAPPAPVAADASDAGEPAGSTVTPTETGSPAEAAQEALNECLATLAAMHEMAQTCNARLHELDSDELANSFGHVFDAVIAGAAGILDVLVDDWRTAGVG